MLNKTIELKSGDIILMLRPEELPDDKVKAAKHVLEIVQYVAVPIKKILEKARVPNELGIPKWNIAVVIGTEYVRLSVWPS